MAPHHAARCARTASRTPHEHRVARRHRGSRDPARRHRDPHAHGGRPLALGPLRRGGAAQVREPPAHGLVQDARRLHPDLPAHRRGARPRRGRGVRGQPRAGRGAVGPAARGQGDHLHAGGGADPQDQRHSRVRRGRGLPRPVPPRRDGRGARVRGRDRGGPDPPLRPRRHRQGPGHLRARDPRADAVGPHRPRADRRGRAAGRGRDRAQGEAPRPAGRGRAGGRRRGVPALAGRGCAGAAGEDDDDGRRHRRGSPRRHHLRDRPGVRRRDRHRLRGVACHARWSRSRSGRS